MYRLFGLTALFCLLTTFQLTAQVKASKKAIRQATSEEVARYRLSPEQSLTMEGIQSQRLTNLAAIEPLKAQNYKLYLQKRKAIRLYAEAATYRLLLPSQQETFSEQVLENRKEQEEALLRQLKTQGATAETIEMALLELENPH